MKKTYIPIFVCFFIFLIYMKYTMNDGCLQNEKIERKNYYNGIVADKEISHENHGIRNIVLSNEDKYTLALQYDAFNYIEIGDSVYKLKGETKVSVVRNHEVKVFYYICHGDTIKQ